MLTDSGLWITLDKLFHKIQFGQINHFLTIYIKMNNTALLYKTYTIVYFEN